MNWMKLLVLIFLLSFIRQGIGCNLCNDNDSEDIPVKLIKIENIDVYLATVFFAYDESRNEIIYLTNRNDSTLKVYNLGTQKISREVEMPKGYESKQFNLFSRHDSVILGEFNTGVMISKSNIKEWYVSDTGLSIVSKYKIQNFYDYPIVDYLNERIAFDLINGITTNLVTGKSLVHQVLNGAGYYEIADNGNIDIYQGENKVSIRNYNLNHVFSEYAYVRLIKNNDSIYLIIWEQGRIQIHEYGSVNSDDLVLLREVLISGEDMVYLTLYSNGIIWLSSEGLNVVDLDLKL